MQEIVRVLITIFYIEHSHLCTFGSVCVCVGGDDVLARL